MARVRVPWPWEGQPDPLEGVRAGHPASHVALPAEERPSGGCVTGGETPGARRTIDRIMGDMVRQGFSVESASRRARAAAIRWDRKHR